MISYRVPGRIEVLGKHTDYAGGRSLLAAVEQAVTVHGRRVISPSAPTHVTVRSTFAPEAVQLTPGGVQPQGHWAAYAQSVVNRLVRNFGPLGGVELEITSTLPPSSGMSSSSALVVGVASVLVDLAGLRGDPRWRTTILTPLDEAGYFATMENGLSFKGLPGEQGVGTFGGSEDHTAMFGAKEGHLGQFSFAPTVFERYVPLGDEVCFVVAVSGVLAEKTGAAREAYNAVSARAAEILRRARELEPAWETLRDAVRADVARVRGLVVDEPVLRDRLDQFVIESEELVPAAGDAVAQRDWARFGEVADASQRLAQTHLGNQVPKTVALAAQARELGALGASAFGAGFGGSVWALVPSVDAEAFASAWEARYRAAFAHVGPDARFLRTGAAGPVRPG